MLAREQMGINCSWMCKNGFRRFWAFRKAGSGKALQLGKKKNNQKTKTKSKQKKHYITGVNRSLIKILDNLHSSENRGLHAAIQYFTFHSKTVKIMFGHWVTFRPLAEYTAQEMSVSLYISNLKANPLFSSKTSNHLLLQPVKLELTPSLNLVHGGAGANVPSYTGNCPVQHPLG